MGQKINLSLNSVTEKIINHCRGGFCYELNYSLSLLLESIGFNIKILSAQVYNDDISGKPFDHLLLLVNFNDEQIAWVL